jgi:hypothetical protein
MEPTGNGGLTRVTALGQGVLLVGGGLWPLAHMASFERVFGPKVDRWLVRTVALLLTTVGSGVLLGGLRRRIDPALQLVGMGTAASLAAIDLYYVKQRRIARTYLLDAGAQVATLAGWAIGAASSLFKRSRPR